MRRRNKRCCLHELAGRDLHDTFNGGLQVGLFIVIQNALCVNHTSPLTLPTLSITLLTHSPLAPLTFGWAFFLSFAAPLNQCSFAQQFSKTTFL